MTTAVTPAHAAARIIAEGLKLGLNLGKPVPCEYVDGCGRQAAWQWHHCCVERKFCQEHHHTELHRIESRRRAAKAARAVICCALCHARPMPEATYHPI